MVFIKPNSLKSGMFFNSIFIPCFSGSRPFRVQVFLGLGFLGFRFFSVQVFLGPGFSGLGPGSGSSFRRSPSKQQVHSKIPTICGVQVSAPNFTRIVSFSRIFSQYQEYLRLFVIHFFDYNVPGKNLLSSFLQKFRRPVLSSCKLITFNSN